MKTALLISALAVSLNACAIDSVETDVEDTQDSPDGEIRRLSANALNPFDLSAVSIPVGQLTQSYVNSLSATKPGREALTYLVNCALAVGNSIVGSYTQSGTNYTITYSGGLGLFSTWKTATPNQDQQRSISGCVLARLNETSRTLTISLRGNAYTTDATELANYVYPEGGFFGNVFAGADNHWGSCDTAGPTHPWRQCSQDGHCAPMGWAGDCATACTTNANGDYASCTGANGVSYAQPTTVFLNSVTL